MQKKPRAEDTYNPFSGFDPNAAKKTLGSKLKPLDYSKLKTSVPAGTWTPFSARLAKPAQQEKIPGITEVKKKKESTKPAVALTQEEAEKWRADQKITVFGENCPTPMTLFGHLRGLAPESVLQSFSKQNFTAPTPIQAQAWPICFSNCDMVGIAKTGSGKTLAFMVPAIAHMLSQEPLRPNDGPLSLVLAPTRELAQQIEQEAIKVLPAGMNCACVYGGTDKVTQLQKLRQGAHVVVATPGRLIDLLEQRRTNLLRVTYLVMDEADRMLDMGFEPQVRAICSQIRKDRQTLMFSATWPREIQALAAEFQRDFIRIHVGSTELLANSDVRQHFIFTTQHGKHEECQNLLTKHASSRVLIFTKMKRTVDDLEYQFKKCGLNVMGLHGDKEQRQREWILAKFKKEKFILIATDVAARGLDVKDLDVVINYDFPMTLDDYVHRIGRTGRAGQKGDAYSLLTKREDQLSPWVVQNLIKLLEKAQQSIPTMLQEWADEAQGHSAPSNKPSYQQRRDQQRRGPSFNYIAGNRPSSTVHKVGGSQSFSPTEGDPVADRPKGKVLRPRTLFGVDVSKVEDGPKRKAHRIG